MQSSRFASSAIKTTAPNPIRVVLIEDLREVREGLAALINGTSGFQCTGSYFSMEAALSALENPLPDVILTDIGLPGNVRNPRYRNPA
jgi:DNA-binding NarL/FixJ family response regulator